MLSLISWERRPGSSDDKTKLRGSGRGQIHTQARLTLEPLGYYAWLIDWCDKLSCLMKTITSQDLL